MTQILGDLLGLSATATPLGRKDFGFGTFGAKRFWVRDGWSQKDVCVLCFVFLFCCLFVLGAICILLFCILWGMVSMSID
jgi:hypothetical protein